MSADKPPVAQRQPTTPVGWRFWEYLVGAFATLWITEQLGFLAIILAGLQGAFGMVLLWQMGVDRPLRLRPLALLRERLFLTVCFLVLNVALSVLAANRGYELSPDGMHWIMPSFVSGAIALVMPWIMTFTQHYAIECAADCLGVTKAIALIACVLAGMLLVVSGWVLLVLLVLAVIGTAFVLFFLLYVAASAFLLFAEVLGEFVRRLPSPSLAKLQPVRSASAIPASIALLVLAGGGYFFLRGLAQ